MEASVAVAWWVIWEEMEGDWGVFFCWGIILGGEEGGRRAVKIVVCSEWRKEGESNCG